jgi:hypothetical protein
MIAGHFGFAALVKSRERPVPLWALMLATVWLDVVFVPLFMMGTEYIQLVPGTHGGYGNAIIYADYTHSLVGALFLSSIFGIVCSLRWGRRSGIVLGFVSFSHWLLDLIVHRGDLPILPGNLGHLPRLGFGLWRIRPAAAVAELALVVIGAWLYWRAARSVADSASSGQTRAAVAGLLILFFGLAVLMLDVTSIFG